jgi:hypothetical protein
MTVPSPVVTRAFSIDAGVMSADIELLQRVASGTDAQPSSANAQFGSGQGTFKESGNLNVQISSVGVSPGATGADNVVAVYSLPANSFDVAGREIQITANGSFAANGDTKTVKVIFNPSTAVVGSTVGAGGTTLCSTGAIAQSGGGWQVQGSVVKYGAAGSNTQLGVHNQAQVSTAVQPAAPSLITATENAAILVAITANCATTASDVVFNLLTVAGAD